MKYTKEEIEKKIQTVPFWGHKIPLPYGIMTPGVVMNNLEVMATLKIPENLSGKRVLDVGTWDGFFSFECEKRGANVVAIDNENRCEKEDEKQYKEIGSRGFEVAKDILDSKCEFRLMDLMDVSPANVGMFDIVLFLGVLYHLPSPLVALQRLSAVTKDAIYIETACMRSFSSKPIMQYAEGKSFNADPTNFFIPNKEAVVAMLHDSGFKRVEVLQAPSFFRHTVKCVIYGSIYSYGRCIVAAFK